LIPNRVGYVACCCVYSWANEAFYLQESVDRGYGRCSCGRTQRSSGSTPTEREFCLFIQIEDTIADVPLPRKTVSTVQQNAPIDENGQISKRFSIIQPDGVPGVDERVERGKRLRQETNSHQYLR
jgi:hypothetical protein